MSVMTALGRLVPWRYETTVATWSPGRRQVFWPLHNFATHVPHDHCPSGAPATPHLAA